MIQIFCLGFCFYFDFIINVSLLLPLILLVNYSMEVSHPPGMPAAIGSVRTDPAIGEPDSMDIDMDIDLGPIEDEENPRSVHDEVVTKITL